VRVRAAALLAATLLVPSLVPLLGAPPAQAATRLTGVFAFTPGTCSGGTPSGSYFRMILASGTPSGPFLSNSDSACDDETYTLLSPGSDRGLRLGELQPQPSPVFDGSGNARASGLIRPVRFYGVDFSAATNAVDPQTGAKVSAPQVAVSGSTVSADLRALGVSWNNQHFNQGAPKPDGTTPGNTRLATGRYDAATGALTLHWTSQIQGGPFNGFTGLWHLTGKVSKNAAPAATTPAATQAPGGTVDGGAAPTTAATTPPGSSATPSAAASVAASRGTSPSGSPAPATEGAEVEETAAPPDVPVTTASQSGGDDGGLGLPAVLAVVLAVAVAAGGFVVRRRS